MSRNDLNKQEFSEELSKTVESSADLDDAERREMLKRVARIGAAAVPAAAVLLNSKAQAQATTQSQGTGTIGGNGFSGDF